MKIYKTMVLHDDCNYATADHAVKMCRDAIAWPLCNDHGIRTNRCMVTVRGNFSHDLELTDKQVAKMLPAWAKAALRKPKSIGDKVTAFYAVNNKVVTGLHHSGFIVGSEQYHDWLETQPDPFRNSDKYRRSIGELRN